MKLIIEITLLVFFCSLTACEKDDVAAPTEAPELQMIPTFAIVGVDLTTGSNGNVVTWTDSYQTATTINLQEELDFQFGSLRNTIGSELAVAIGFPTSVVKFYDVSTGQQRTVENFFNPENDLGDSYLINTSSSLLTYYLDAASTCCAIYLNTYGMATGDTNEVYLGNADIAPVQFNVFARGTRSFATAIDTFTGQKKLFVHNAITGESLGVRDVDQYGGFMYNDVRDELYLFDFTGASLNHVTLDIETFVASEPTSFPAGFQISDGINDAQFSESQMIFKDPQGIVSSIYSFDTNTIVSYSSTDLINTIFNATGRGITITNTAVDLNTNSYIVMGTYLEEEANKGIVVALTLDKEVIVVAESGDIRPDDVVFLN